MAMMEMVGVLGVGGWNICKVLLVELRSFLIILWEFTYDLG